MIPSGKQPKPDVNYGPGRPNTRCGVCLNYRVPNTCTRVDGSIDPDDACDLFNHDALTAGEE